MKTIDEILRELPLAYRELLMYAFECNLPDQFVEWTPGRFIGVNFTTTDYTIEQTAGRFVEGRLEASPVILRMNHEQAS